MWWGDGCGGGGSSSDQEKPPVSSWTVLALSAKFYEFDVVSYRIFQIISLLTTFV